MNVVRRTRGHNLKRGRKMTFDEWWEKYSKISSLNREYLSFLDADRLKDEMRLAFYHRLPDKLEEGHELR